MKLQVTTSYTIEEGIFPTFVKGTEIKALTPCRKYPNWYACEIEGYHTYEPEHFVRANHLVTDYNPTELAVVKGDIVELLELHYQWALVSKGKEIGWLPCEILVTSGQL